MIQPIKEIKSLGKFKVKIYLHSEVDAEITYKCYLQKDNSIIIQFFPQFYFKFSFFILFI